MPTFPLFDTTPESQVMLKWLQYQKGNALKVANYCDRIAEALEEIEYLEEKHLGHESVDERHND